MSVLGTCFLLGVLALSAEGILALSAEGLDRKDPGQFKLFARKPGDEKYDKKTLTIRSLFDRSGIFGNVYKMEILISSPQEDGSFYSIALVTEAGTRSRGSAGHLEGKYYVVGGLNLSPTQQQTSLEVMWRSEDDGYCGTYISRVTGLREDGVTDYVTKTLEVGPRPGSSCPKKKELQSNPGVPEDKKELSRHGEMPGGEKSEKENIDIPKCDEVMDDQSKPEIPEYIKAAFPDATANQQEQILNKINSIDKNTYDVFGIYQGRVYIATMKDTRFQLDKMNELCKSAGGYLVELDSPEEQQFVRDFLKSIGHYRFYTGANDVETEGKFVYYNSKKPVTNVVWLDGQPNNYRGNEDCVEILPDGLNDNRCSRIRGYICEIPLLDSPPAVKRLVTLLHRYDASAGGEGIVLVVRKN